MLAKNSRAKFSINMWGTIITLPGNFASGTLAYTGYLFDDLSVYILMIVGITLGLIVLEVVVNLIRK